MALEIEGVVDDGVHAEKPLGRASRLEPLHLALSPSHHLMRVFNAIIFAQPLLMWAVLSALAPGGGYQSSWGTLLLVLGGMNRDAVPGVSINGHQASV